MVECCYARAKKALRCSRVKEITYRPGHFEAKVNKQGPLLGPTNSFRLSVGVEFSKIDNQRVSQRVTLLVYKNVGIVLGFRNRLSSKEYYSNGTPSTFCIQKNTVVQIFSPNLPCVIFRRILTV